MKNNHEITRKALENRAAALEYIADEITPAIIETLQKFEGKQGNKKLEKALNEATENLCYISSCQYCDAMQYEILYHGPAWWMQVDGDKRPRPEKDITAAIFWLDGPHHTDRVKSDNVRTWADEYREQASDLRSAASGNDLLINEWNNTLKHLQGIYKDMPDAVTNIYWMNSPACYYNEIKPE